MFIYEEIFDPASELFRTVQTFPEFSSLRPCPGHQNCYRTAARANRTAAQANRTAAQAYKTVVRTNKPSRESYRLSLQNCCMGLQICRTGLQKCRPSIQNVVSAYKTDVQAYKTVRDHILLEIVFEFLDFTFSLDQPTSCITKLRNKFVAGPL